MCPVVVIVGKYPIMWSNLYNFFLENSGSSFGDALKIGDSHWKILIYARVARQLGLTAIENGHGELGMTVELLA